MNDTAIVQFYDYRNDSNKNEKYIELELPLFITANDLVIALNETYDLGMNTDNIFSCYLVAENPMVFLRGNKTLKELGIRDGSKVIYRRDN